ncbi:hypothetical protein MNBD_NITROSPINAE01-442 [hydrothermal vent metagenome]|uniref:Methyltransferase type 11 domain-containing protein n=1 Tax=hydrothermal vent metagenome TaxID=652676 RepID=A0A3B1BT30_9ZZZZ
MSSDIKLKIRRAFDQSASQYDRYADFQNDIAHKLSKRVTALGLKNAIAVEMGCGTGTLAKSLAESALFKSVTAYDISFAMLCETKKAVNGTNLSVTQADAELLPFKNDSVDLTATNLMLQWAQDLNAVFAETARSLKPEGRILATCLGQKTFHELRSAMTSACHSFGKEAGPSMFHNFPGEEKLVSAAQSAGFSVKSEKKVYIRKHDDAWSFIRSLKRIGVQNSEGLSSMGLGRRQIMKKFADEYRARYALNDGVSVTYEVIYLDASLAR